MNRFRSRGNRKGFTMIELMVVVVIVGVLAAIAIPLYGKYVKNARLTEATSRIGEIVTAAKAYALENDTPNPTWPAGAVGVVDLAASDNFTYAITDGGGSNASTTALEITATGIAGSKMAGVTVVMTIPDINSNGGAPAVAGL